MSFGSSAARKAWAEELSEELSEMLRKMKTIKKEWMIEGYAINGKWVKIDPEFMNQMPPEFEEDTPYFAKSGDSLVDPAIPYSIRYKLYKNPGSKRAVSSYLIREEHLIEIPQEEIK